jgi:hypothetical protein
MASRSRWRNQTITDTSGLDLTDEGMVLQSHSEGDGSGTPLRASHPAGRPKQSGEAHTNANSHIESSELALTAISDTWEGRRYMSASTRIIRAVLLAAAAAALAIAAYQLREKHQEAELTVQDIHDQLDALDPATRAAVVARLTSDEVKKVRDHRQ